MSFLTSVQSARAFLRGDVDADPGECPHARLEYRRGETSNGGLLVRQQCLDCGGYGPYGAKHFSFQTVLRETGIPPGLLKPFDQQALDAERERRRELEEQKRALERQAHFQEWADSAAHYYNSDEWRKRRDLALRRDQWTCQACLAAPATEVHHLSYAHFGAEPLFELTSVCSSCHSCITNMDRKRRGVEP